MHCVVAGYVLGDEYEGAAEEEESLLAVSGGGVDYGGQYARESEYAVCSDVYQLWTLGWLWNAALTHRFHFQ